MNLLLRSICFALILGLTLNQNQVSVTGLDLSFPSLPSLPKGVPQVIPDITGKNEKCYGEFGCYKRFPPSSIFAKLVNIATLGALSLFPSSPEDVDPEFLLYTCANRYRPFYLDWNSTDEEVREAPFDPKRRTIFIIHGFTDNYDEMNWMGDMKDFILNIKNKVDLKEGVCENNVIGVDWSGGSKTILYPQAVANTQIVGAAVAKLIRQLMRLHSVTPDSFIVVGHSLGAHASGFVGTHFQNGTKLRNIIGLDPAGPAFTDVPNTHRLDPSDAQLVLTLHTNGGKIVGDSFGIVEPLGHYSFYPNGGSDQPGCEKTKGVSAILMDGLVTGLADTISCSHRRATLLVQFNESLVTTAQSMAYTCDDYDAFAAGKCGNCTLNPSGCKPFGHWFDYWSNYRLPRNWSSPVSYYIDTSDLHPYSVFHTQMVVKTRADFEDFKGYIKITPVGEKRDGEQIKIDPGTVRPNTTYTHLLKVPKTLGEINRALVRIKNDALGNSIGKIIGFNGEDYNPTQVIAEIKFNFMSHKSLGVREDKSTTIVPTNKTAKYRIRKIGWVFEPASSSRARN